MDIHHLRIFSSVYRLRSFTGASKELNVSQPTISEHIKNLEKELACSLFDRLGRSIMPTTQADLLFPRAQQLLDSLESLKEDLDRSGDRISGNIIFGASTIPGTYLLPSIAVNFTKKHPDVTFEVLIDSTQGTIDKVLSHEIFCGIVGARSDNDKLEYIPLVHDEMVLVCKDELCPSGKINPTGLLELPFLLREKGSGTRKTLEELSAYATGFHD